MNNNQLVKKNKIPLFFVIFWWFFLIAFISVTYIKAYIPNFVETKNFKEIEAVIISKDISAHRGTKGGYSYRPEIKYSYFVNNNEYLGMKYLRTNTSRTNGWAEKVISNYQVGQKVSAWHNPNNPVDVVLRKDTNSDDWIILFFMAPFFYVGLFMLASSLIKNEWLKARLEAVGASGFLITFFGIFVLIFSTSGNISEMLAKIILIIWLSPWIYLFKINK